MLFTGRRRAGCPNLAKDGLMASAERIEQSVRPDNQRLDCGFMQPDRIMSLGRRSLAGIHGFANRLFRQTTAREFMQDTGDKCLVRDALF